MISFGLVWIIKCEEKETSIDVCIFVDFPIKGIDRQIPVDRCTERCQDGPYLHLMKRGATVKWSGKQLMSSYAGLLTGNRLSVNGLPVTRGLKKAWLVCMQCWSSKLVISF